MRKAIRVGLLILAFVATGALAFRAGIEVAARNALRNSLLTAAQDVWVLERMRSVSCQTVSAKEAVWIELMIKASEDPLLQPAYRELVEGDTMIRDLRDRTEKVRRERNVAAPPPPEAKPVSH
jgi:hypothetical protein